MNATTPTPEQQLLREAAQQALGALPSVSNARAVLDGAERVDLWPVARRTGWPGLLVPERFGGVGLGLPDALIVFEECGRRLTGSGLLGHLVASSLIAAAAQAGDVEAEAKVGELASGDRRAAVVLARPPLRSGAWTVEGPAGRPTEAPALEAGSVRGYAGHQLDLAGASAIVVVDRTGTVGLVEPQSDRVRIDTVNGFDGSRALANATFEDAPARRLDLAAGHAQRAWLTAQALLSADSLGVCEALLGMSVEYAKDRHAFGRPIGSYQAIKHQVVEMLRWTGALRSLSQLAGWTADGPLDEFALASESARFWGEAAAEHCAWTAIAVHGGIGATWEHDAQLYWRRSKLSRLLLGGLAGAADTVAERNIEQVEAGGSRGGGPTLLTDTPEQAELRDSVRERLERLRPHAPERSATFSAMVDPSEFRAWQRRLASEDLVGVTWPTEYGGAGLGPVERMIVDEELELAGLPGIIDQIGVEIEGPVLIAHGTDAQKERYLGPLLRGEEGWCQLFSEPAAGSDLAGVISRASPQEDGSFVLNGQKVWSTLAHACDFGVLLARTDPDVPKHKGLTMFVLDMSLPGVTTRPLRLIHGEAHFNEVFLDDVVLPADAVLGEVNRGWTVAMTALMFERLAVVSTFGGLGFSPERFIEPLLGCPEIRTDSRVRWELAALATELLAVRVGADVMVAALGQGTIPGPEAALGKIGLVEAGRRGYDLAAELLGPEALRSEAGHGAAEICGLRTGGGTEEILRTMIGDRVLGLPAEPRVDKTVSFRELSTPYHGGS